MSAIQPSTEVQYLKGVGPRVAPSLHKLGLHTAADLLMHLPRRYEDRRHLPPIKDLRPGDTATVRARLVSVDSRPTSRGMVIIRAVLRDATGHLVLTWFNQPWIRRELEDYRGEILAFGQVKAAGNNLEIASPEWERIGADGDAEEFARIVPIYPATEGVTQKTLRRAIGSALSACLGQMADPLPERLQREHRLPGLQWSLRQLHAPDSEENRLLARRRLVFEEFFYLQSALALRRAETQQELGIAFPIAALLEGGAVDAPEPPNVKERREKSPGTLFTETVEAPRDEPLWSQIHRMLPFDLTNAQRRVVEEVWSDMARPHPMNRLVQGDVGSGKTAVAACAMLAAVRSGYQAALMAPTEILAEQHAANLRRLFEPLGIEVELLVGKLSATQKRRAAERVAGGQAHLAVGTHAIIQEGIAFHRLGLAVIDEQHRFGVLQRKALRDKGYGNPDVLVMTATPIPRTLTLTMYGDLDVSVIDELPPGRKPIKTHWKRNRDRPAVYKAVRELIDQGRQAYFVCPMVSESEKMMSQAAEELHRTLQSEIYADLRVGLLHGQMRPKEKEEVMERFRRHDLDILVSTTVIEVGVDVPNASVMVIEDANRFGLSQLHQLRGRVGRGGHQSFCILVADATSDDARERLETMVETTDGFVIAEKDLELRGPGVIAGTQQSGAADFKVADLLQDGRMLEVARQAALREVEANPGLVGEEWSLVRAKVRERRTDLAVIAVS